MAPETENIIFGRFVVDLYERKLFSDGVAVPISPKSYDLLLYFAENSGEILEKARLMDAVWPDSFVEEGNLSFTVGQLRKALGDNIQSPLYIETIPRRGYRFIAPVERQSSAGPQTEPTEHLEQAPAIAPAPAGRRTFAVAGGAMLVIVVIALFTSGWLASLSWRTEADQPAKLDFLDLTTNGSAYHAEISPDGKSIVYVSGTGKSYSLWLRQLETDNHVEIMPAAGLIFGGLRFSPEGDYLYYTSLPIGRDQQFNLYRMSIFGGVPKEIAREVQGRVSISNDGSRIAFIRCYYKADDFCSLWIANPDGEAQEQIALRPDPYRIGSMAFDPNGSRVVFAAGQSENASREFALYEVDLATRKERELPSEKFFNIRDIEFVPETDGLLITAGRNALDHSQIWYVDEPTGKTTPLTNESSTYSTISIDRSGATLVATRVVGDFKLNVMSPGSRDATVVGAARSAAFTRDGRIVFTSMESANGEIWSMSADGTELRQLTNHRAEDARAIVWPEGDRVLFMSNRTGEAHVWMMNMDGTGLEQITRQQGGFPLRVTPDGRSLFYHSGIGRTLRRVDMATGKEFDVIAERHNMLEVSHDGSLAAHPEKNAGAAAVNIRSTETGASLTSFHLPNTAGRLIDLKWHPDGKHIDMLIRYSATSRAEIWRKEVFGGEPKLFQEFVEDPRDLITIIVHTPDGSSLAFIRGRWKSDAVVAIGVELKQVRSR
ncbi:MAG: winged helix-turn-helix domain-containing protein [Blastocatellia bacterium]|nr:winged helix-turn-helix domain-containing protein [Blastocatellia bacterium]